MHISPLFLNAVDRLLVEMRPSEKTHKEILLVPGMISANMLLETYAYNPKYIGYNYTLIKKYYKTTKTSISTILS